MSIGRNIGKLDMILRLGLSAGFIYAGFINTEMISDSLTSILVGTIGVLNLVVALIGFCPLYALAGINTGKID